MADCRSQKDSGDDDNNSTSTVTVEVRLIAEECRAYLLYLLNYPKINGRNLFPAFPIEPSIWHNKFLFLSLVVVSSSSFCLAKEFLTLPPNPPRTLDSARSGWDEEQNETATRTVPIELIPFSCLSAHTSHREWIISYKNFVTINNNNWEQSPVLSSSMNCPPKIRYSNNNSWDGPPSPLIRRHYHLLHTCCRWWWWRCEFWRGRTCWQYNNMYFYKFPRLIMSLSQLN